MANTTTNKSSSGSPLQLSQNPEKKQHALLYDPEDIHISKKFAEALKELVTNVVFHLFESASAHELQVLPLLVIVRSTTPRYEDDLNYVIGELNEQGHSDLRNVVLIYYHVTSMKEPMITGNMKCNDYKGVRTVVEMDFNKMTLKEPLYVPWVPVNISFKSKIKPINEAAKEAIYSTLEDMSSSLKAFVYYSDSTPIISDFLQFIEQNLPLVQLEKIQDLESTEDGKTPLVVIRQIKEAEECDIDALSYKGRVIIFEIKSEKTKNEIAQQGAERNILEQQNSKQVDERPSVKTAKNNSRDSQDTIEACQNKKRNTSILHFTIFLSKGVHYVTPNMFAKTVDFLKH